MFHAFRFVPGETLLPGTSISVALNQIHTHVFYVAPAISAIRS